MGREIAGRYVIQKEIARGGMGVVYLALDKKLKRPVAIKGLYGTRYFDEESLKRFQFEVMITANLFHPNIVQVYEIIELQKLPVYIMEYVEGIPLDEYAKQKGVTINQIISLMIPVCKAVGYAHSKGIIHRDIKPGNIVVTKHGEPKVMDFGLARFVENKPEWELDDSIDFNESPGESSIVGSPCYMSPEQARGDLDKLDTRTDIFSLGVTLYLVLTHKPPYLGKSYISTLKQVLHTEPVRPRKIRPEISPDLEDICLKAMAKDPEQRYRTTFEMADDMRNYLKGRPVTAREYTFAERAVKAIKQKKKVFVLSLTMVWLIFIGLFFVMKTHYGLFYTSLKNELRTSVKDIAATSVLMIDGDTVETVRTLQDLDRPEVKAIIQKLEDIKNRSTNIEYVWIMRHSDKRKGYLEFVLENDMLYTFEQLDKNNNNKIDEHEEAVKVSEVYEESRDFPELMKGFDGPTADYDIELTDKWNISLSGYCPLKNSQNETIGVFGVDVSLSDVSKTFKKINLAFNITIAVFFILTVIFSLLIFLWIMGLWQGGKEKS